MANKQGVMGEFENFVSDKGILEFKFIGRGGLGAKSAGEILADVASELGFFIQAFPEYGAERMGAPVMSFVRISNREIQIHSSVVNPDVVVLLDKTLLDVFDVTEGMSDNGILIVNSESNDFKSSINPEFKGRIFFVDASGIALRIIGKNVPNTPLLGAVAKVIPIFPLELINRFVEEKFKLKLSKEVIEKNKEAVKTAFDEVKEC